MKVVESIIVSSKNRRVRDILFTILFILYWIGMIAIIGLSFYKGDVRQLISATDVHGNYCGAVNGTSGVDMRNKPYILYLFNAAQDVPKGGIRQLYPICVSECPTDSSEVICRDGITPSSDADAFEAQLVAGECFRTYATLPMAGRCIPHDLQKSMFRGADRSVKAIKYVTKLKNSLYRDLHGDDILTQIATDLWCAWAWIGIACALAIVLSFLWLLCIQYLAWFVVWTTLFSTVALLATLTTYLWALYSGIEISHADTKLILDNLPVNAENSQLLFALAIFASVVLVVYILAIIVSFKRISLAVSVIQTAGSATARFPSLFAIPLTKNIYIMGLSTLSAVVFALLASCADELDYARYLILYFLFGFFWTYHVICACGDFMMASVIAAWYWTPRHERKFMSGWKSLKRAFNFTFLFHFGSLVFGSLILAMLSMIRFLLDRVSKELKQRVASGQAAPFTVYVSKAFHCLFGLLERIVRYLNTRVYIEIAIHGCSFIGGVRRVGKVLTENPFRALILEGIASFVLIGAKISITTSTMLFATYALKNYSDLGASVFYAFTLVMILILSFIIASTFVSVMQMAIDTVFICFLEECTINPMGPSLFMPTELIQFSDYNKRAEA